ncbi:MAG TPA: MFS transporter [Stellaceae bacterium]|nr:MFS transporter [Stellaceae bacterium]
MTGTRRERLRVVAVIGTTQTLNWASSYYLPAILGAPIAAALGLPQSVFFAVFSGSLLLSAALGPAVGRLIDRRGGRSVLAASSVVLALGLVLLAAAEGVASLVLAWTVLGIGIAMGLYDPAFSTLTRLYGREARGAITGITLIAGFASTIGWPLSAVLAHAFGWRAACLVWAGLDLFVAAPLNGLAIPSVERPGTAPAEIRAEPVDPPRGAMPVLAFYFSATWFVTGAMAAHLPELLRHAGASEEAAIAAAALVGPAQVAARLVEFGVLRLFHPLMSGRIAALLHPVGAVFLALFGAAGAVPFALFYGAGNGMITIAKGSLPLALFGPAGFGERSGVLSAPARLAQSSAPFLFGLLLGHFGVHAVAVSAGLCLAAFASLLLLRTRAAAAALPAAPG